MGRKRVTVPTAHGEVSYDVVECDSCGAEVDQRDAYRFVIYDLEGERRTRDYSNWKSWSVLNQHYSEGWACPYCYDAGPIDFPRASGIAAGISRFYQVVLIENELNMLRLGTVLFVMLSAILWVVTIIVGLAALVGGGA